MDRLKLSLSLTLVHYYSLAGRLKTSKTENPHAYIVYVDLNNSPGARLIHASLDIKVSDIVSQTYVPPVVYSFFDHHRAINHDGHTRPLLSIQVTDLVDGVFIGTSMNQCLADGTCYWHFLTALSEAFKQTEQGRSFSITRKPIIKRWFPEGHDRIVNLPFKSQEEFLRRYEAPKLLERCFHFTAESIAKLKSRANREVNRDNEISSFQSLAALVWRSITRARRLNKDETTCCFFAINSRPRLEPPLSQDYFGFCVNAVQGTARVGELLENDLGWGAWKMHEAVVGHTNEVVRRWLDSWEESPVIYKTDEFFQPKNVFMGSSPRFNKYGIEFGLGKAVALRSGYANKSDGKVSSYPGREGGGSVDLEICLAPDVMHALESDKEFMSAAA